MSTKKAKIVANGAGLALQSVPGESILYQLTGAETGGALDYMIVTVAPNTGPPLHVHHTQEEVFHILKGRFKFQAGDETTFCEEGDFAYVPAGTPHAFINLSDEPGKFIAVFTPGGTDRFFAEFGPMMNTLSANVRETRSTQRIRVGRRQRKRTCWDCEREWKRMVVPLEPGRPSEARQLLRTRR